MRLELALVVGILLFCSWCAYIVARMSSSVNVAGQTPSTLTATANEHQAAPDQQHRLINQTGPQQSILIDHLALRTKGEQQQQQPMQTNFNTNSGHLQQQQQQQQLRQFGASETVPITQNLAGQLHWAPYANQQQQPQASHPAQFYNQPQVPVQFQTNGNGHWQAYALPTTGHSLNLAPDNLAQEEELQDDERKLDEDSSDGAGQAQASADGEFDYGHGADSNQRPVEGDETDQGDDNEETGAASTAPAEGPDEDEQERELESELPPVQSELEEFSNRRSFDELESDERERDRDGHLVQSSRRHLINGKPVAKTLKANGGAGRRSDARKTSRRKPGRRIGHGDEKSKSTRLLSAPSGRKQTTLPVAAESELGDELDDDQEEDEGGERGPSSGPESDFEGMVREIDHEDKLQRAAAKAAAPPPPPSPPSSQTVGAVATEANAGLISVSSDQLGPQSAVSIGAAVPAKRSQPTTVSSGHFSNNATTTTTNALERRQDLDDGSLLVASSKRLARNGVANQNNNIGKRSGQKTGASSAPAKDEADAKDSHEHRVQETLVAQEWDDDSDGLPEGEVAEAAAREVEELRRDEDQDQVGNIVDRDDEARQLEKLSRKLLKQSVRVPDELERRKRHAPNGAQPELVGRNQILDLSGSGIRANESDARRMTRADNGEHHREGILPGRGTPSVSANSSKLALMETLSVGQSGSGIDRSAGQTIGHVPSRVSSKGSIGNITLLSSGGGGGQVTDNAVSDIVSGSEDMHVAVLAQPPLPPPLQSTQTNGSLIMSQPVVQMPTQTLIQSQFPSPAVGPQLVSHHAWPGQAWGAQLASGSHKVTAKKKNRRHSKKKLVKRKRSKLLESKNKAAKAYANKQRKGMKKGNMNKKRRKLDKESLASRKHFEGLSKGKKLGRGHKSTGGKKKSAYLKDKGFKKKGFKRSYHKLETGDHKTYFDEFRDKDQKKRWKDFDDKHKYSQNKKWAGYDSKHHNKHKLHHAKGNASKLGKWNERSELKHLREANKYKGSKRLATSEGALKKSARLKRRKKKKKHKSN